MVLVLPWLFKKKIPICFRTTFACSIMMMRATVIQTYMIRVYLINISFMKQSFQKHISLYITRLSQTDSSFLVPTYESKHDRIPPFLRPRLSRVSCATIPARSSILYSFPFTASQLQLSYYVLAILLLAKFSSCVSARDCTCLAGETVIHGGLIVSVSA